MFFHTSTPVFRHPLNLHNLKLQTDDLVFPVTNTWCVVGHCHMLLFVIHWYMWTICTGCCCKQIIHVANRRWFFVHYYPIICCPLSIFKYLIFLLLQTDSNVWSLSQTWLFLFLSRHIIVGLLKKPATIYCHIQFI